MNAFLIHIYIFKSYFQPKYCDRIGEKVCIGRKYSSWQKISTIFFILTNSSFWHNDKFSNISLTWFSCFFSFFPIDLWLPECTIRGSYTIKSPNLPNKYSWGTTLWRINSEKTIWHTGSTQKHRDSCVSHSRHPPRPPFFFLFIFQNSLLRVTFLKYLKTSFGILSIKDTVKCLVQLHQRWLHSCTVQEHWLEERWRMYPKQYPFSHNYLSFFPFHLLKVLWENAECRHLQGPLNG